MSSPNNNDTNNNNLLNNNSNNNDANSNGSSNSTPPPNGQAGTTDPIRNRQPISSMSFFLPFPRRPRPTNPSSNSASNSDLSNSNGSTETAAEADVNETDGLQHGVTWTIEVFTGEDGPPLPSHRQPLSMTASPPRLSEQELRQEPGPIPSSNAGNVDSNPATNSIDPSVQNANPDPNPNTRPETTSFTFIVGPGGRVLFGSGGRGGGPGDGSQPGLPGGSDLPFFLFPFGPFGGGHPRPTRPDPEKAKELLRSIPTVDRELMQRIEKIYMAESDSGGIGGGSEGEDSAGWKCPICLEGVENEEGDTGVKGLPCNHLFHEDCLQQWFATKHTCPTCRYDLDPLKTLRPSTRQFPRPRATGSNNTPSPHPYVRPPSDTRQPLSEPITDTPFHASPQEIDVEQLLRPLLSPTLTVTEELVTPSPPQPPSAAQLFGDSTSQQPVFTDPSLPEVIRSLPGNSNSTATAGVGSSSNSSPSSIPSAQSFSAPSPSPALNTTSNRPNLAAPRPVRLPFIPIRRPTAMGASSGIPPPHIHLPIPIFFPQPMFPVPNAMQTDDSDDSNPNETDDSPTSAPPLVPSSRSTTPTNRPSFQSLENWALQRERSLGWKCDAIECTDSGKMIGIYSPLQTSLPKRDTNGGSGVDGGDESKFVIMACEHKWHKGCLEEAERIAGRPMRVEDGKMWVKCDRCRKDGWVAAE